MGGSQNLPADLIEVSEAWATLPAGIRSAVVAMVRAAKKVG
jgi:hypothetical protein